MNFKQYMKAKGKKALTKIEMNLFGIDGKKGWPKRHADVEITNEMLFKLMAQLPNVANKVIKGSNYNLPQFVDSGLFPNVENSKRLYLMTTGDKIKIGISNNPLKRARQLTTSGGQIVEIVAIWDVSINCRDVERFLHKHYSSVRLQGEWFHKKGFSIEEIENNIPGDFTRCLSNPEALLDKVESTFEPRKIYKQPKQVILKYDRIECQTEKAFLVYKGEEGMWISKSVLKSHDLDKRVMKYPSWSTPIYMKDKQVEAR